MKLSDFNPSRDQEMNSALLQRVNQTATRYPRDATVPGIFAQRASESPEVIAVLQGDTQLTYGALDRQSSQLARFLVDLGVGREALVAVMLDRSPAVVVAMLGAMKAGGAYLPIGADLPEERVCAILRDSRARVVIADSRHDRDWRAMRRSCPDLQKIYFIDREDDHLRFPDTEPFDRSEPGALAYVMYTSGTMGTPKGVMIEHRPILRLVLNTNFIRLGAEDRILQTGALSFDAATFEIWGPLLNGGSVYLPPQASLLNVVELKRLIRDYAITTVWLTAGLFNALVAEDITVFDGLRTVLSGGERLSPHHVNLVRRAHPGLVLINGYGPTENTTFTTTFAIDAEQAGEIPIGRPIANTTVHILDEKLESVAIGVPGELYAGGDGLARGYLNDPALTDARFIPDPFRPGDRLYRTGDVAQWQSDGTIAYLGRVDNQLKIRGYRIEPGEIETVLLQDGRLLQALVLTRASATGDQQLIAYYRARNEIGGNELRDRLRGSLPDYMVPAMFVQVDEFPLTQNGKVDKAALPAPTQGARVKSPEVATETETTLIDIWKRVLGQADIDADSNFFDLGGHSLRAVKLMHLIHEKFNVLLPFTIIFEAPTLRGLAERIIDAVKFGHDSIDQPLVALTKQPGAPVLFAFPPGTADALGYSGLAGRLSPHGFYAFNFIEADTRIEDYARLILGSGQAGPYVLFGYSGGGNLAFRTAVALERRGERVSDIVMLDSSRFLGLWKFPRGEAERLAREFVGNDSVQPYLANPALKDKVIRVIERYYATLPAAPENVVTDANIHLVTGENSPDSFCDEDGRTVCSKSAWAQLTSGAFRTYQGSGEHAHMLHAAHLEQNAALLRSILAHTAENV